MQGNKCTCSGQISDSRWRSTSDIHTHPPIWPRWNYASEDRSGVHCPTQTKVDCQQSLFGGVPPPSTPSLYTGNKPQYQGTPTEAFFGNTFLFSLYLFMYTFDSPQIMSMAIIWYRLSFGTIPDLIRLKIDFDHSSTFFKKIP